MFEGFDDILPWFTLALGAALALGTLLALVRPPPEDMKKGEVLERPPLARSLIMIAIGVLAAVWGAASLLS